MSSLSDNPAFRRDYEQLKAVSVNPDRHAAANAYEHCERVQERVVQIATLNGCAEEDIGILSDLARVHDIGKITGTANPGESVELLHRYGTFDQAFMDLVRYHDANLPWYQATQRGEPPGDRAWNKLARRVDLRLLCLFMVADRVDCPGGWRTNRPLVWFLEEVKRRGLLPADLVLDDGPYVPISVESAIEVSAGGVLLCRSADEDRALVIRVRKEGFEVPKGHVEAGESKEDAVLRELREETGLASSVTIGPEVGTLEYTFDQEGIIRRKIVHYFAVLALPGEETCFAEVSRRTKELRWITASDLETLLLVNEDLKPLIARAFCILHDVAGMHQPG